MTAHEETLELLTGARESYILSSLPQAVEVAYRVAMYSNSDQDPEGHSEPPTLEPGWIQFTWDDNDIDFDAEAFVDLIPLDTGADLDFSADVVYGASGSNTFTNVETNLYTYSLSNNILTFNLEAIGTVGGASSAEYLSATLPATPTNEENAPVIAVGLGRNAASGAITRPLAAYIDSTNNLRVYVSNSSWTPGPDRVIRVTGSYEVT